MVGADVESGHDRDVPQAGTWLQVDGPASTSLDRPGATFKTLGRKRTLQGKAVISRYLDELEAAEARVNEIYFAWRSGAPTELDDELNTMLECWRALPDGGDLVVEWPARTPAGTRRAQPG